MDRFTKGEKLVQEFALRLHLASSDASLRTTCDQTYKLTPPPPSTNSCSSHTITSGPNSSLNRLHSGPNRPPNRPHSEPNRQLNRPHSEPNRSVNRPGAGEPSPAIPLLAHHVSPGRLQLASLLPRQKLCRDAHTDTVTHSQQTDTKRRLTVCSTPLQLLRHRCSRRCR